MKRAKQKRSKENDAGKKVEKGKKRGKEEYKREKKKPF